MCGFENENHYQQRNSNAPYTWDQTSIPPNQTLFIYNVRLSVFERLFDNDYQTNVLILDNQTLYINNVRLRGYIAARSTIRGVDIHSQLRTIFIIATHQLNTRTTNPLPILPLPYTVL